MPDSEAELLARARDGDLDSFAEFVRLFERRVRGVLGRFLDNELDVEEAAQDTFVQAWRGLGGFRGEAAPSTWLYRIAVNEALQRLRRKRVEVTPLSADAIDEAVSAGQTEAEVVNRETLRFLAGRLRSLPLESRAPLVLRDIEGWSYEDTAEALGVSVAAVKSRIHRARLQLSNELRAWQLGRRADSDPA